MIVTDLSNHKYSMMIREQLNINFTANLNCAEEANMFFTVEEAKENVLDFSQGTLSVL